MDKNRHKKIGILGGTFDPPHYGHLLIAQSAAEEFGLDRVLFLPTGNAPHKKSSEVTAARIRYEMVSAAIRDNPLFDISDMESANLQVNYTYRTLQNLQKEHPDARLYFIMGEDSLDDFSNWKRPEVICATAVLLVAARLTLFERAGEKIEAARRQYSADIQMLPAPYCSISSREIRERVRTGKSARYMIPEAVEEYIRRHFLYL